MLSHAVTKPAHLQGGCPTTRKRTPSNARRGGGCFDLETPVRVTGVTGVTPFSVPPHVCVCARAWDTYGNAVTPVTRVTH